MNLTPGGRPGGSLAGRWPMRRSVSPLGCRGKGDKGDYRPCVRPADGRRDAQAAAPVVIRVSVRSVLVRERACKYTSTRVLVCVCVCVCG